MDWTGIWLILWTVGYRTCVAADPVIIVVVVDEYKVSLLDHIRDAVLYVDPSAPTSTVQIEIIGITTPYSGPMAKDYQASDILTIVNEACQEFEKGAFAMLDISSPDFAPMLKSFAGVSGIPYISMLDESFYSATLDNNMHFIAEPPGTEMLTIIAEIVRMENMTNIAIIYDDAFDLQDIPRRILSGIPAQHMYQRMLGDDLSIDRQLNNLKDLDITNFFLVSDTVNASRYLFRVEATGLTNDKYNWIILTKDRRLTCDKCKTQQTIIFIRGNPESTPMHKYTTYKGITSDQLHIDEAFVFDLMLVIRSALDKMGPMMAINYTDCYTRDVPPNGSVARAESFLNILRNETRNGVFGRLRYDGTALKQNIVLELRRVTFEHGVSTNNNMVHNDVIAMTIDYCKIGNWSDATSMHLNGVSVIKSRDKKHYIVVTVAEFPPFVSPSSSNTSQFEGYCIDLLNEIADRMQFTYEIYEAEDKLVGTMDAQGNWNGMINDLILKKADFAIGPLSVMAERENVIDFTVPYYDLVGMTILMKRPEVTYSLFRFLTVLDEAVWGCITGAFFLFSLLLCFFDRFSPFSYQNNRHVWNGEGHEPRVFSLKEGIWFCMMSLTPQGGGEAPRALSGRLIAATWWLFGFIIIATYTANLAAFLTVSRLETPINSLDDLSKQFKIKYSPMLGTSSMVYFERMADIEKKFYTIWKSMSLNDSLAPVERAKLAVWDYPVSDKYTKLWNAIDDSKFPNTTTEALSRVKGGEYAFIADATQIKYMAQQDCSVWEIGEEFSRKPYAFAVQEGSILRDEISNIILQLLNQRYLEDLKATWWNKNKRTDCSQVDNESDGISINNIGGVFLVIVIGSGLALFTLAFEFYWYKYRPSLQPNAGKDYNIDKKSITKGTSEKNGNLGADAMTPSTMARNNEAFEISENL